MVEVVLAGPGKSSITGFLSDVHLRSACSGNFKIEIFQLRSLLLEIFALRSEQEFLFSIFLFRPSSLRVLMIEARGLIVGRFSALAGSRGFRAIL